MTPEEEQKLLVQVAEIHAMLTTLLNQSTLPKTFGPARNTGQRVQRTITDGRQIQDVIDASLVPAQDTTVWACSSCGAVYNNQAATMHWPGQKPTKLSEKVNTETICLMCGKPALQPKEEITHELAKVVPAVGLDQGKA